MIAQSLVSPAAKLAALRAEAARNAMPTAKRSRSKRSKSNNKRFEDKFAADCGAYGLPRFERGYAIAKRRQTPRADGKNIPNVWRFDFAWPEFLLLVEIDGGIWRRGGGAHSHPLDIERNIAKQNDAALVPTIPFITLRFTTDDAKSGSAVLDTQQMLKKLGWDGRTR